MEGRELSEERNMQDVEAGEPSTATPPEGSEEIKVSLKREREVSLEPGTPQAASIDVESSHLDTKHRHAPAKKNRVSAQLDATAEEEEGGDNALGLVPDDDSSPRHETKIREISQGLEDITWQNMVKGASPAPEEPEDQHEDMDTEHDQQEQDDLHQAPVEVPPALLAENQPEVQDDAGADEDIGAADSAEVPPNAQPEDPTSTDGNAASESSQAENEPTPASQAEEPVSLSRRGSDESMDQDKNLKRKLADRTVSDRKLPGELLPEEEDTTKPVATKRPRDEEDADANPRETKRPTPPPDEEKEEEGESTSVPPSTTPSLAPSEAQSKATTPTLTHATPAVPPAPSTPKLGGFMAYASTSSPFASVKGPSLFNSMKPSPWASASTSTSTAPKPIANPTPVLGDASGSPPRESSLKRTGFEAFASSSSPFAAKRPKSPTPALFGNRSRSPARHHSPARVNAFSAYASGGAYSFATPAPKRASSGSPAPGNGDAEAGPSALAAAGDAENSEGSDNEKGVSFGERLRASKDDDEDSEEKKLNLTEQEVQTGEEDEETVYQVRGKLYAMSPQNQWKERGTGQLKLNVRREDGSGARLLMRKEAVYTLLLNATLFKGMKCFVAQDPRYIRFSVFEDGATTHYNLRVSNAKIAAELLDEINSHIP